MASSYEGKPSGSGLRFDLDRGSDGAEGTTKLTAVCDTEVLEEPSPAGVVSADEVFVVFVSSPDSSSTFCKE